MTVDVKLTGQVPSWRPTSGHMYFGEHDEHFFAWLPAVPQGEVSVDLNIRGKKEHLQGSAITTTTGVMCRWRSLSTTGIESSHVLLLDKETIVN